MRRLLTFDDLCKVFDNVNVTTAEQTSEEEGRRKKGRGKGWRVGSEDSKRMSDATGWVGETQKAHSKKKGKDRKK